MTAGRRAGSALARRQRGSWIALPVSLVGGCLEVPAPADSASDAGHDAAACVESVALASITSCALLDDGSVWCFGYDDHGELGNDPTQDGTGVPVAVHELDDAGRVIGGPAGFCAVRGDDTAWCWGTDEGRFGDGAASSAPTPVRIEGLSDVTDLGLGTGHLCALRIDGTVWCRGDNGIGQLGDGSTVDRATPVQAAIEPAAQIVTTYNGTCALHTDGQVSCWGEGLGPDPDLLEVTEVEALSAHAKSVYALRSDGAVWAWGDNNYGQLGDGMTTDDPTPHLVVGLDDVVEIAAGGHHACARRADGSVWCWGRNQRGQLGAPGEGDSSVAIPVEGLPPATALAAGQEHACIVAEDGGVHCWGYNCCGQLGQEPLTEASAPLRARLDCAGD